MKAVSAEYLGPILDPSSGSKHITKSLASLTDIQENGLSLGTASLGLSLALRDPYHRDRASRTISLPVRGHTLYVTTNYLLVELYKSFQMLPGNCRRAPWDTSTPGWLLYCVEQQGGLMVKVFFS